MNFKLTQDNVQNGSIAVSDDCHFTFVGFASDLRLPPGVVPRVIETTLGNRENFVLESANEDVFVYSQVAGCVRLHIYND